MMSAIQHMWRCVIGILGASLHACCLLVMSSGARADTACLKIHSPSGELVLGIDREYFWPRDRNLEGPVGGFTIHANWRDLSPRINKGASPFEYAEVTSPDWSIDTTTAGSMVRVSSSKRSVWPLRRRDSPNYIDVESELPGWRKVETCKDCNQVLYFPVPDDDSMDVIECIIRPYGLEAVCRFNVRVSGLLIGVFIPKPIIRHYKLFLNRTEALISKLEQEGRTKCSNIPI